MKTVYLVGTPNCGKTLLFNELTGAKQKVGNYAGVTVEKKEGTLKTEDGKVATVYDLPGLYSLEAKSLEEEVSSKTIFSATENDVLAVVVDATQLERNLRFALEVASLGRPVVLLLNMWDLAAKRGLKLDVEKLSSMLGLPVITTSAAKVTGIEQVKSAIFSSAKKIHSDYLNFNQLSLADRYKRTAEILKQTVLEPIGPMSWTDRLDAIFLHPVFGGVSLFLILVLVFQAVFTWAPVPADAIEAGVGALGKWVSSSMPEGDLKSLIQEGVFAGVGAVLVFLPQIALLFLFIVLLEDSGYMARAAFLMDRLMRSVGLNGRAFVPLLSSFACAIPGVMATRTLRNPKDRLLTILIAPLLTCSARLPVYTLLIAAFIPNTSVLGWLKLPGLVMLSLYVLAVLIAVFMALLFKKTLFRSEASALLMELPTYKVPTLKNVFFTVYQRSWLFIKNAGTLILGLSILLWFVASYPKPSEEELRNTGLPPIALSYAGKFGRAIEPLIKPIGFDWRIGVALVPGFAAREVMVSALSTVYAIETKDDPENLTLAERLKKDWSLPTALSLLVWYVIAMQCISTLAVIKRETNSWRWPAFVLVYMTVLAYIASFVTFRLAGIFWG